MEQITFDNVIDKILAKFPEYKKSVKYYDDSNKNLHHIILGNLALMAFENIDNKTDISLAERLVKFTDEILNSPNTDEKLANLFVIEIFEKLVGSRIGAKLAKNLLNGKSLEYLDQTLKHYHTQAFLEEYKK